MNKNPPTISVIMPVYNAMPYLPQAIESIINQTYTNWELIIVNNNSTDESPQCAEQYAVRDGRVKIFTETNQGEAHARNTAIRHATGDYICFCDADDEIHPQKLALQLAFLTNYRFDGVFTAHNWLVNGQHQTIIHCTNWTITTFYANRQFPCMASLMVKRDILMQTQLYKNIKNGPDVELFLCQLPQFARLGFMPDVLYHYRMHTNNVSRTGFANINIFILHYIAVHGLNSDEFHFPFGWRDLFHSGNLRLIYWVIKFHYIYFVQTPPYIWGRVWRILRR